MLKGGSVERNKEIGPSELEQILRSESQPKMSKEDELNYQANRKVIAKSIDRVKKTVSTGGSSTGN